jgi:hypothetical protein
MKVITMNTDWIKPAETLNDEQAAIVQQKIYKLLAKQIKLYTVGDSSSVTTDTAKELLTSIIFTLDLSLAKHNATYMDLLSNDIEDVFREGQEMIREKTGEGKARLETMKQTAPTYANEFYWATYRGIKTFFACYNPLFLAHQIPGEIDYPLCIPLSEKQLGIEYINDYLKRVLFENHILSIFNSDFVSALLRKCYMDFETLPVSLCEPVIINAAGLTFLGEDALSLSFPSSYAAKMKTIASAMSESELKNALKNSAGTLCSSLDIFEQSRLTYVKQTVLNIAPRFMASIASGDLSKIFIEI